MEPMVRLRAASRAQRIHDYLEFRADRLDIPCMLCGEKPAIRSQTRYAYETPWDDEPVAKYFCSDDCGDTYMYEEPWAYFMCHSCDREICEQNPWNGWHIQYRMVDGEQICLKCYRERLLDEGLEFERERLEDGEIPGMFFSYGNLEAKGAGYEGVPGFTDYHVDSQQRADAFRKKALELLDGGRKVIIGYERLAIGGGEGYVTLMAKDCDKAGKAEAGQSGAR